MRIAFQREPNIITASSETNRIARRKDDTGKKKRKETGKGVSKRVAVEDEEKVEDMARRQCR